MGIHPEGEDDAVDDPGASRSGLDNVPGCHKQQTGKEDEQTVGATLLGQQHKKRCNRYRRRGRYTDSRAQPTAESSSQPNGGYPKSSCNDPANEVTKPVTIKPRKTR